MADRPPVLKVLKVFLASPGDIQRDRDLVESVVGDLDTHLRRQGITLGLWKWERDAEPGFGRPQDLINPNVDDADFIVALFWNRLGTPTTRAASGTVEELQRAFKRWKRTKKPHAFVYFCDRPTQPLADVDQTAQREGVIKLERSLRAVALTKRYRNSVELKHVVYDDLFKKIHELYLRPTRRPARLSAAPTPSAPPKEAEAVCDERSPEDRLSDIDQISWRDVDQVSIICHTGKTLFLRLCEVFERVRVFPPKTRLLLRTPQIEGLERSEAIELTLKRVANLQARLPAGTLEVRFYESLPSLRGFVCRFRNGKRLACTSSYQWNTEQVSKRAHVSLLEDPTDEHTYGHVLESWFKYYWGKDEIHTVVFDFDDTLVDTRRIQIDAWLHVIGDFLARGEITRSALAPPIRRHLTGSRLGPKVRKDFATIFLQHQLAEAILGAILPGHSSELAARINGARFAHRSHAMARAKPFKHVRTTLAALAGRYNLAIVSSTDEELISNYLGQKGWLRAHKGQRHSGWFNIILGKSDPGLHEERASIQKKAYLFLKLSALTGIPLTRMVYVGDNRSDFIAARQVGMDFIEARVASKTSLLGELEESGRPLHPPQGVVQRFTQLEGLLGRISQAKARSKRALISNLP